MGSGVGELERERESDGRPYLGEKRRASDGRPRRSDILPSRASATKLQVRRWYRVILWVVLGERNYETERESEGERRDEGATAGGGGHRGTSSRGEGGCTHDAHTASLGSSFLHRGCLVLLLLAVGRWKAVTFASSPHSLLFLSSTRLKNYGTRIN